MLYVFSGDDTSTSRQAWVAHCASLQEKRVTLHSCTSLDELETLLQTQSLFSDVSVCVLNTQLNRVQSRTRLASLVQSYPQGDVVVWDSATDPKVLKKSFPQAQHAVYMIPVTLWKLLDALAPGNLPQTYALLQAVFTHTEHQLVLYMMQRRLKELLLVALGAKPAKIAPWQIQNLQRQAKRWGVDSVTQKAAIQRMYHKLTEIEQQSKSGTLAYSVDKALDICACFYLK